jgi:predicted helicase
MTIHTLLAEFRKTATSTRDLGDKFERLMRQYLTTDPLYKNKYSDVWLWMDWPAREGADTGIDLVAKERYTGEYCAIQCKCYEPSHTLQKADIDSFFTASGKQPFSSRLIISTTDDWGKHAEKALENQNPPVTRIGLSELANSPIDWNHFLVANRLGLKTQKQLRPHQKTALKDVLAGFKKNNRGQLIMACGTGKTYTALKIAEKLATHNGPVLFLVPSISLLSQTLREWAAEASVSLNSFTVCSDSKVSQKREDMSTYDLAFPATTEAKQLATQINEFGGNAPLTVIFSTYQSIETLAEAQKLGLAEFELIICDEAHRTTGVTLEGQSESYFVKVHNQAFLKAKKRLYMTATPRIYSDNVKSKAEENLAELCSMDDTALYGPEFHRLGFSEAVRNDLLSDYQVMILAVEENSVSTALPELTDEDTEIDLDDAVRIIGCWNGLSKRLAKEANYPATRSNRVGQSLQSRSANLVEKNHELTPMRRAVAFSRSIKDSKQITALFLKIVNKYHDNRRKARVNRVNNYSHDENPDNLIQCEARHVDGTFNALKRHECLDWLKQEPPAKTCRILSNARCLSEGVDVPALDAVMFLNPRNSVVDVVQSVGRVMRKSEGKKYGYIILPIGIPANVRPEIALKNNQKYKLVWQVLQALRAHDDRFNATINQIELNKSVPKNIQIIGVGGGDDDTEHAIHEPTQFYLNFPNLEEWRNAIYGKIVLKCGDRRYWESWAADLAQIAERHTARITAQLTGSNPPAEFNEFVKGLQSNLNPSITDKDAIEMLSQHLITRPVFDALFEHDVFAKHNPVSQAMQKMLYLLDKSALKSETATLDKFYASVKQRAEGIDNAEGKQKIIIELYDKFFKTAFPRLSERLGIVYTPIEVVDFMLKSAEVALRQEFGVGLTDKHVHLLDPFTGTGTFIVRLLQSGLIKAKDLARKYQTELHANEIVLLAYYIAAVNIEAAYHGLNKENEYRPFNGIVLTDTFQLSEDKGYLKGWKDTMLPENSERAKNQNKQAIQVIIGNPPYSAGQGSENDNNQNLKYPQLDDRISQTYAKHSSAKLQKNLYDSYIRAIRLASDRLQDKGIVCYVSNGSFIDGNNMDGLRQCLTDEFSTVYCFNLRGNQRTSGETSRQEGGKIFGAGSRASIAISVLIKNPKKTGQCQLFYHDIGDYLSREDKLNIIKDFDSLAGIKWSRIKPNASYDWINQRDPAFDAFLALGNKENRTAKVVFTHYSQGILTSRDSWTYNFSRKSLAANMNRMIDFYNEQVKTYQELKGKKPRVEKFIETDSKKISWSGNLKKSIEQLTSYKYTKEALVTSLYRPFCKQWLYFNRRFNERVYQMPRIFPNSTQQNLVICVTGRGATKEFSALISEALPDLEMISKAQCFPLYTYEKLEDTGGLFSTSNEYVKTDNIPDTILAEFRQTYNNPKLSKEDIFYYVYGILHSPEYRSRFKSDLKKMIPRIPFAQDFKAFSQAGRELAKWHLNYETIEPYPLSESTGELGFDSKPHYQVQKMRFAGKARQPNKTTIIYNNKITLSGIPLSAYDYKVNGKSAIEWIMERYQVTTDKKSGIKNDPNDWSDDPRYIIDLVKRMVRVSLETMKIVGKLPKLNEKN